MRATAIIGDWQTGTFDGEVPLWRRVARATVALAALTALVAPLAHAGIIEDAVKSGLQGMLDYVVGRVNSMTAATIPTSFNNLFDGSYGGSSVYHKALSMYSSGTRGTSCGRSSRTSPASGPGGTRACPRA